MDISSTKERHSQSKMSDVYPGGWWGSKGPSKKLCLCCRGMWVIRLSESLNMQTGIITYVYSDATKPNNRLIILLLSELACRAKVRSQASVLFTWWFYSHWNSVVVILSLWALSVWFGVHKSDQLQNNDKSVYLNLEGWIRHSGQPTSPPSSEVLTLLLGVECFEYIIQIRNHFTDVPKADLWDIFIKKSKGFLFFLPKQTHVRKWLKDSTECVSWSQDNPKIYFQKIDDVFIEKVMNLSLWFLCFCLLWIIGWNFEALFSK